MIPEELRRLWEDGSEFGGAPGLPPHDPTPSDRLHLIYATDPTNQMAEVYTEAAAPGFRKG